MFAILSVVSNVLAATFSLKPTPTRVLPSSVRAFARSTNESNVLDRSEPIVLDSFLPPDPVIFEAFLKSPPSPIASLTADLAV